jgi:N-acetyl sugar amidotransferase
MSCGETHKTIGELQRCTKCVMPETWESINFDACGACNICKNVKIKQEKIDWTKKKEEFAELVAKYRDKDQYDCVVPFSGGKDSVYTLYSLVKEFGLKPLVVSFDHGFYRPKTLENRVRVLKKLGVDFLSFRPNWHVVRKLMLESLKRKGDFCWHCHTGIFAYPMQIAVKFNIPLVIWGEPSAEYTGYYGYDEDEEIDARHFNRVVNLGINAEDMVGMIDDIDMRDLEPFKYPSLKELKGIKCRSVCLGSYIPWDVKKNVELIQKEIGWEGDQVEGVPAGYEYEKIECMMQGIRDYLKFIKRGMGRTAHLTSIDVRNGRMDRETALELTKEYDGRRPESLDVFLEYIGIDEEEFMEIAMSQQVAPNMHDPSKTKKGDKLWDQDLWDKTSV